MSENSVGDSTVDEREDRNVSSSKVSKRLKTLFCCSKRERLYEEEIVECDPEEYDYVVEKLVVKRVPLALFAMPVDFQDRRRRDLSASDISQSTFSSTFDGNDSAVNAIKTATGRIAYDPTGNKALHLDKNKNRNLIRKRFSGLNGNLKKSGGSPKNSLNFSQSKESFVEDISEVESNTRTNASSKSTSSLTTQDNLSIGDISTRRTSGNSLFGFWSKKNIKTQTEQNVFNQLQDVSPRKNQVNFIPGWNRKYIISPFRVQSGSFDLTKPKSVDGDFGVNGKSLKYIKESLEDKSSELGESLKDETDSRSNTAVRWRITVRHQRPNANAEPVTPEM